MKKQKNILLVSSKYMPEYSGSGYRAHHLYKRLCQKYSDITVNVLCGSTTENTCETYNYEGVTVNRISKKINKSLSANRFLRTWQVFQNYQAESKETSLFLKKLNQPIDLIHVFGECYPSAEILNYAREKNIPVIIEICNEVESPHQYIPFPIKLWKSTIIKEKLRYVCISENLRKMCLKHNISDSIIWCRPNPVDETRFHPIPDKEKIKLRKSLTQFSENDILISYVAKFRPSKNHALLLDVIHKLPEQYKLFLKGPLVETGPLAERDQQLFERLKTRIEAENLEKRVELHAGFADNVDDYYKMADVYAFPSITEGLGTPILESLACGVPVVSNLIPDTTDVWIKNDENGFLSALEPDEFATKLCQAAKFSAEKRHAEAGKIAKVAGTKILDEQYYQLIQELTDINE